MIPDSEIHLWFCARNKPGKIMAGYLGVREESLAFKRGDFGKPRLEAPGGLSFNISHAGERHLLALSSGMDGNKIGVDLVDVAALNALDSPDCRELLADHFPGFYKAGFSDAECVKAFSRLWAQSEAILKARGIGLNKCGLPLSCCELNVPEGEWREVVHEGEVIQIIDMEIKPGFHAALAVPMRYKSRDVCLLEPATEFFIEQNREARKISS